MIVVFGRYKVLDQSDGIEDMGNIKWDLALCLVLAWIVVYVCICKGIKSSGKVLVYSPKLGNCTSSLLHSFNFGCKALLLKFQFRRIYLCN